MFTGLIQLLGRHAGLARSAGGWRLNVAHPPWPEPLAIGESVAVQGVCLTVHPASPTRFEADLLDETLDRTAFRNLAVGAALNLERALRPMDRLGGHFVTGHVDETGRMLAVESRGRDQVVRVGCSARFARLTVLKGSVALDGVSLTVSGLADDAFEVNLIPHTWAATSLHERHAGDAVHLESDLLGKHVARLLGRDGHDGGVTLESLDAAGFV